MSRLGSCALHALTAWVALHANPKNGAWRSWPPDCHFLWEAWQEQNQRQRAQSPACRSRDLLARTYRCSNARAPTLLEAKTLEGYPIRLARPAHANAGAASLALAASLEDGLDLLQRLPLGLLHSRRGAAACTSHLHTHEISLAVFSHHALKLLHIPMASAARRVGYAQLPALLA